MLRFPVGTVIKDAASGEVIADLARDGERALLAKGGNGGLGNLHFKSSTNRAPRQFTRGLPGEARQLELGAAACSPTWACSACPTPASRPSSARCRRRARRSPTTRSPRCIPTWAWYAWTRAARFVVADIPGLIEGAAEGAGLGHQFLRHLQRTHLLLHLVDMAPFDAGADPAAEARALARELKKYDPALARKPRWLVLNKSDLLDAGERARRASALVRKSALDQALVRDLGASPARAAASSPSR